MCVTAVVWGATFIAQKTGMETIGPMGFTFGRYLIGAGVIIPLALYEARKVNLLQALKKDQSLNFGAFSLGVIMFGGIGLQQTALIYTNVANAAFLTALYVPLVPLIAAVFLRRHVPLNIWPAVLLSLTGSYFLSGNSSLDAQFGDLLIIAGAFFWAGHILLIQHVLEKDFGAISIICLSITCHGSIGGCDHGATRKSGSGGFFADVATAFIRRDYGRGDWIHFAAGGSASHPGGGGGCNIVFRVCICSDFWLVDS